jgi:hypothetical protein
MCTPGGEASDCWTDSRGLPESNDHKTTPLNGSTATTRPSSKLTISASCFRLSQEFQSTKLNYACVSELDRETTLTYLGSNVPETCWSCLSTPVSSESVNLLLLSTNMKNHKKSPNPISFRSTMPLGSNPREEYNAGTYVTIYQRKMYTSGTYVLFSPFCAVF